MNAWLEDSINNYYKWLKDNTSFAEDKTTGWFSITTPFTGLFNDNIEIFVKQEGSSVILSDDGNTISNLNLVGVPINRSTKRKQWLNMILLNYGIICEDDELKVIANHTNFAQKKHNLICAISEISEMEVLSDHSIAEIFKTDVQSYLDEQNIIYTPQFIAKGSTGLDFTFDFQIAGKHSEIVIKSFNRLNKINVPNFIFGWDDIKDARKKITGKEIKGLAIINDTEKIPKQEYIDALLSRGSEIILWKDRFNPLQQSKLRA